MSSNEPPNSLAESITRAAREDRVQDLQSLLEKWESPDRAPLQRALSAALQHGHVGPADLLLDRGCHCGFRETQAALKGGHKVAVFECMLRHGWDIDFSLDHRGDALVCSLLFAATPDLPRWLLEHGADPNANPRSDPVCSTALEAACSRPSIIPADIVSLLLERGAVGSLAGLVAAWNGNVEALRVLLDEGGEVFGIDAIPEAENPDWALKEEWGTPLHGAAAKGEVACVEFLLSRGARTDIRNGAGLTPEQTAEYFEHKECLILKI
ncbi:hypothetical protein KVR01_006309 [Diaporthe batatas]|uniref:uncharacterized protein n=1 Tax=Diaporthe batatas TaxID=748121 RepID=UPI001D0440AB|nr:uncharacterized protein KVR01_006309 [Diaporthe batatas]KAG8164391.1 hypothetical protein KVR01_006309 [Diaporthe batatas]